MPSKAKAAIVVADRRKVWREDGQQRCDDACCKVFQCAACERETAAAVKAAKAQLAVTARAVAAIDTVNQVPHAAVRVWAAAIGSCVASDLAKQRDPYVGLDPSTLLSAAVLLGPNEDTPAYKIAAKVAAEVAKATGAEPPSAHKDGYEAISKAPSRKKATKGRSAPSPKAATTASTPKAAPSHTLPAPATVQDMSDSDAADSKESDDGCKHDTVEDAFKPGDCCYVPDYATLVQYTNGKQRVKLQQCAVQRFTKCRSDGLVSSYTVKLPDGSEHRAPAQRCFWTSSGAAAVAMDEKTPVQEDIDSQASSSRSPTPESPQSDTSESDDGFPHDDQLVAFKPGDACFVLDFLRDDGNASVETVECKVQSIRRCRQDGLVSKYTVLAPDGTGHEVAAHVCYANQADAVDVFKQLREQSERRARAAGGAAPGTESSAPQAASLLKAQPKTATAKGKAAAKPAPGLPQAQEVTAGQSADDAAEFDEAKQMWCFTTRMLAWKKIRERNPWAQSERMVCWADCAAELRHIIDNAIVATSRGDLSKDNRVEPRYKLYLKGKDAKGNDKDGHALQNMFSRHAGSAKAREAAEKSRSGNGDGKGAPATKQDRANELEEREILMELLSMQEQADLYKHIAKSSKQSLKSLQEVQCHDAIVQQTLATGPTDRKHLELLASQKRALQNKVEILRDANAAMSDEDKKVIEEVLKALEEVKEVKVHGSESSHTAASRTGGRAGGKPKRGRGDAFEDTMASLSAAALRLSQSRSEETKFESTMREYMQRRIDIDAQAPAAAGNPRRSFMDTSSDVEQQLQKLKDWLEGGLLTPESYRDAVSRVLDNL